MVAGALPAVGALNQPEQDLVVAVLANHPHPAQGFATRLRALHLFRCPRPAPSYCGLAHAPIEALTDKGAASILIASQFAAGRWLSAIQLLPTRILDRIATQAHRRRAFVQRRPAARGGAPRN